jgi:hypothetical protein
MLHDTAEESGKSSIESAVQRLELSDQTVLSVSRG